MKNIIWSLFFILFGFSFFSCGSDDDDTADETQSPSLEGVWYLKSEVWYDVIDGKVDMSEPTYVETYDDYADERIISCTKVGDTYYLIQKDRGEDENHKYKLKKIGTNKYEKLVYDECEGTYSEGGDEIYIKSLTQKGLVVEHDDGGEWGIYTFMKK